MRDLLSDKFYIGFSSRVLFLKIKNSLKYLNNQIFQFFRTDVYMHASLHSE